MVPIELLTLKGASPASVAITFEVIALANRLRRSVGRKDCFSLRVTGSGAKWARALAGLASAREPPRAAKVVVVPGLAWMNEEMIRTGLARQDARAAREALQRAYAAGADIASSCSGVFLVASAGLLDNRRATTSWWLAPQFRQLFPAVSLETESMVVRDRRLVTAGASMAQLDLMLSIVARFGDAELADRCARFLLLEQRQSQSRYMALSYLTAGDEKVRRAECWAADRLHRPFTMADLARAAGLEERTFARRCERATGFSPVRLVQRLRVERAMELLETTRCSLEEIAHRVGYADPSTLRRLLRREAALSPREVRSGG
jgi:transcriptional regulator GlxA family with amidase domain